MAERSVKEILYQVEDDVTAAEHHVREALAALDAGVMSLREAVESAGEEAWRCGDPEELRARLALVQGSLGEGVLGLAEFFGFFQKYWVGAKENGLL